MTWVWHWKSAWWKESKDPSLQVVLWLLYSAMVRTVPVPSHSAPSTRIHKYDFKTLRRFALIWLCVTKPLQSGLQFIFFLEGNSSWLDGTESSQGTLGWIILSHTKEKNRNMWSSESFRKPLSLPKLAFIKYKVSFSCFLWDSISLRSPDWPMQSSGLRVPGFFSLSSYLLSSIISTPRLWFALVIILVGNRWQSLVKGLFPKNIFSPDNPGQIKDSHAIFIAVLAILASATEQENEMMVIWIGKTETKIFMF